MTEQTVLLPVYVPEEWKKTVRKYQFACNYCLNNDWQKNDKFYYLMTALAICFFIALAVASWLFFGTSVLLLNLLFSAIVLLGTYILGKDMIVKRLQQKRAADPKAMLMAKILVVVVDYNSFIARLSNQDALALTFLGNGQIAKELGKTHIKLENLVTGKTSLERTDEILRTISSTFTTEKD